MVYVVFFGLLVLLDLPRIESQITPVRAEWTRNQDTFLLYEAEHDTAFAKLSAQLESRRITSVVVLRRDRFLVRTQMLGGLTLIDGKGQVVRKVRYANVDFMYRVPGLFIADAGWKEDDQKLVELWSPDGVKANDGVFHEITTERSMPGKVLARRGNMMYVLDTNGRELERRALYVIGGPCRENGFTGRWSWSSSQTFDPFMTMGDQERAPEPPWTVPFDSAHADVPIENRLNIRLDTVTPRLFAEKIKAHTVVITNTSPLPVRLSAFAGNVPIRYQVENDEGDWVSVKDDNVGYCGNSGGFHDLASGDSVLIPIPQFVGATKTRFRVVIPYYDTDLQRSEISVAWEGSFNFGVPAVRFRNGPYGYLEQMVSAKKAEN